MTSFADLSGRSYVVTGASSGIGRGIALELARAGADILIHYAHNRVGAEQVGREVAALGRQFWLISCDFHQAESLPGFVEDSWAACRHVDGWIHNAGADILTGERSQWTYHQKAKELLAIDVEATLLLCRLAGQRLKSQGHGVMLTIGWDQSDRGMEGDSGELFAATKNAVMGFTRSLALNLAPEVRVNCIAPGWIRTAWGEGASPAWQERVMRETPLKRWGTPEDIARLARFLVSDEASYLTGQVINANGGAIR